MTRRRLTAALLALTAMPAADSQAQQPMASDCQACQQGAPAADGRKPTLLERTWLSICRDFKRNNNWPDPFVTADRVTARVPFDACVANGWRIQNTLSEHHFVENSAELTESGQLKVAAIINESPLCYRAIFVLRGTDAELTSNRVASIQDAASRYLGDRPPVPVFETYDKPRGTPAYYVDEVTRRYQATIPDPRLPAESDSQTPGSGYGGSGQ